MCSMLTTTTSSTFPTMNDFFSIQSAASHKRRVLELEDPAQGVVDIHNERAFAVQSAQASAVKYIARHVSRRQPDGWPSRVNSLGLENDTPLRDAFAGFDVRRLPEFFRKMLITFNIGEVMDLPNDLWEAAFATDRLDNFVQLMADPEWVQNWNVSLLRGAGYDVYSARPVVN